MPSVLFNKNYKTTFGMKLPSLWTIIIFSIVCLSPSIGQHEEEIKEISDSVYYLKSQQEGEINCEGIYTNRIHPNPDYQSVYEGGYRPFGKIVCYYSNGLVQCKSSFDS